MDLTGKTRQNAENKQIFWIDGKIEKIISKHTENEFQYMTASLNSYHILKIQSIFQFLFKIETFEFLQTFLVLGKNHLNFRAKKYLNFHAKTIQK